MNAANITLMDGRFNGFGGKVEPGETPAQAAARELQARLSLTSLYMSCGVADAH